MAKPSAQPAWKNGLTAKALPEFVSFFRSAFDRQPSENSEIGYILERIASDQWRGPVERLRAMLAANNTSGYTEAKRMLPAFAMSGQLSTRAGDVPLADKFIAHSGYLQADLDAKDNPKLDDIDAVADELRKDPHVAFFFRSPSGKGLKVGVRVPANLDKHAHAFATVERHFLSRYALQIDRSTKDATRLSFVSWDPHVWVNEDAREIILDTPKARANLPAQVYHEPLTTEEEDVREMLKYIPPRPPYDEWLAIASGVWAALPMDVGTRLLMEWSPEENAGEYAKKHRARLTQVGIGTVVHYAKLHGFDAAAAARRKRWCGRIRFAAAEGRQPSRPAAGKAGEATGECCADGTPNEVSVDRVRKLIDDEQLGDATIYSEVMRGSRVYDANAGAWMQYERGAWSRDFGGATLLDLMHTVSGQYQALIADLLRRIAESPAPAGQKDARLSEVERIARRMRDLKRTTYARAVLDLACKQLVTTTAMFDRHPHLLATENGTIDLDEGVHREARPDDFLTLRIPVRYDPEAQCPRWHAFLDVIFGDDAEVKAFIRRAVGYSLSGYTNADTLFFLYGKGANGKSTFQLVMEQLLSGYRCSISVHALLANQADSNVDYQKARLKGRRLAFTDELPEGKALNEAQVKALTGGDVILARSPYEKPYEFTPTHKLWMVGNHQPEIKGTDEGIWRRICLVPFTRTIPADKRRPRSEIIAELTAELAGILNWALEGWEDYRANGLNPPEAVRKATADYRDSQDSFRAFSDERLMRADRATTPLIDVLNAYLAWCEDNKESPKVKTGRGLAAYLRSESGYIIGRDSSNCATLTSHKINKKTHG